MKPSTRLSSAVFQLTPTRTRCELIIIANHKKEKIASGLLGPFLTHLKTAQDQITKGGYTILLQPVTDTNPVWFTKATLERFIRFVSNPEILERVSTIETEILQIEEAVAMQSSSSYIGQNIAEDHQNKPLADGGANKSVCNANQEKAIVLYKSGAQLPEVNESCLQDRNSKVQLLKVLETRKRILQKEQGMAFARAAAAGFSIDHMESLAYFAKCFGALRLLEACSLFMDLWNSKHKIGVWLDIEASKALTTQSEFSIGNASGDFHSNTNNKHDESNHELASKDNGKSGSAYNADNPSPNDQKKYFQRQFPCTIIPPWTMHAPTGAPPLFHPYTLQGNPYYQPYTTGRPFFQTPQPGHKMQSFDDGDGNIGSNKKQTDMFVIQNIGCINSKENKSGSELNTDPDSDIDTEDHDVIQSNGNWQVFQNCLLRGNEKDAHASNESMFLVEKDAATKGRSANIISVNELALIARDTCELQDSRMSDVHKTSKSTPCMPGGSCDNDVMFSIVGNDLKGSKYQTDSHFSETNGRKTLYRLTQEDFVGGGQHNQAIYQDGQANRTVIDVDSEIPLTDKNLGLEGNGSTKYYEPDDFILMPERGTQKRLVDYDPALDYEMQVCVERSQEKEGKDVTEVKRGLKNTFKDRGSKITPDSVYRRRTRGPKPLKMSPSEDSRARAERLRSYKADLQKIKKEKEEAEAKRLEALKLERQKRIAARGGPTKKSVLSPQTKQFPVKLSPVSKSKFSDSEPGLSSPLQRSKIRTSLGSRGPPKDSEVNKLSGGTRLTRSTSSLSKPKRESNSTMHASKASISHIRRLSEPKKVSRISEVPERNKISDIINLDKSKGATLPELKIKPSKLHINSGERISDENAELNVSDDNTIVEKTVVMFESEFNPSFLNTEASQRKSEIRNQSYDDCEKGKKSDGISESTPIYDSFSLMDGFDRDPTIHRLQKKLDSNEVSTAYKEKNLPNFANITTPYKDPFNKKLGISDKAPTKESSSKGLRQLLKFGKRSHNSSLVIRSFDSECKSVAGTEHDNVSRNIASINEVHTIKDLLSQDETSSTGKSSRKISRHFSLFSPFRSKTNEKKRAS